MRKRVVEETRLKSWDDVDMNLMEILEIEAKIKKIGDDLDIAASELKEEAKGKLKPLTDRIAVLEKEMLKFTVDHKAEFKSKKTKLLTHGSVGFRKSSKVSIATKYVADAIQKLKDLGLKQCINVKETLNKEELKKQPTSVLEEINATLKTEDTFGYEIDRESIQS